MASIHPHLTDTGPHPLVQPIASRTTSLVAALGGIRRRVSLPLNNLLLGGVLLLGGLTLGMLVSTQWQDRPASFSATQGGDSGVLASTISRLESDRASLESRIAGLRTRLGDAQAGDASRKAALADAGHEVSMQQLDSGAVAVQGSGIIAVFDDSIDHAIPENEDPANYILHEYDLRDAINSLWIAGAEAISVNGERIVSTTSLYCVGTTIICNTTRLSPPFEVRAIGDPQALADALRTSPQMEKFNQRARIYDLPVKIDTSRAVQVPAYSGSFDFKYAQSPEQK